MSRVPINCADWVGCYSNGEQKLVHALHHEEGQVLLGIIPLNRNKGKPELIHRFDIKSCNLSSDGECFVDKLDGNEVLKKIVVSQSVHGGLRMRYLISEFKMEMDFFNKIPPDDESKLVREIQLTFYQDKEQYHIEVKSWKKGKGTKIQNIFVRLEDSAAIDWILKLKLVELDEAKEKAKKLFLEFRNEMWGITDGQLRGIHEEAETVEENRKYQKAVEARGVIESNDAQVVGER